MKPNSGPDASATKPSSRRRSDLLAVTAGEPAGIGPELCLALADSPFARRVVLIGDANMLAERASEVGSDVQFVEYAADSEATKGVLRVINQPLPAAVTPGIEEHSVFDAHDRGVAQNQ